MKISISYPPLESPHGVPTLSQNRQFQWFSDPTYIYPMIPASAATLLAQNGHEIFWDDAIAEELSYSQWLERLEKEKPDLVVIETKTPIIKKHWKIINQIKNSKLEIRNSKFILMGDHVTALPEESLKNSQADFVLAGGDYDFLLLELVNNLEKYKDKKIVRLDEFRPLDELPAIDRELTNWKLYAEKNGNYKYTPGSYVMNARDCWWGKCAFCSWTTMFPGEKYRVRSVEKALDEIGELIKLGVNEIMEDSGTLPVGKWLEDFCNGMVERGYNKKVKISCNMRLTAIKDQAVWNLMKKAGFRLILFGIESANQETLDRINKNMRVEDIEPSLRMCKSAGLEPHATFMIGWPWEDKKMAENTVHLAKKLFRNNLIDSLQATIAIPYPGTPLYKYCRENSLLLTENYDDFDQQEPVMKTEMGNAEIKSLIKEIFQASLSAKFVLRKIASIRSWDDVRYLLRAAKKVGVQIIFRS
ncbi:MAG: radical SAM protein [Candidatus Moranbacteria bacterium]|nr:radical SAM protein [Candidatus Moranbacteria bacterium]